MWDFRSLRLVGEVALWDFRSLRLGVISAYDGGRELSAWVEVSGDAPDVVVWRYLLDEIDQRRQISNSLWTPYPAGSKA